MIRLPHLVGTGGFTRFMDAQGAAFTEAEVQAAFSKDVETWDLGRAVSTKRGTWDAPDNKWDL